MNTAHLPKLLAFGRSNQVQLAAQLQFLTIKNQILRSKLPKRISLTHRERRRLIRFGKDVGPMQPHNISVVQCNTFLKWLRSPEHIQRQPKRKSGRPPTSKEIRKLVVQMAGSPGWECTRILGELHKLGIKSILRTTIRTILKEYGIEPSPDRAEPTWNQFLKRHASTLWSCDFVVKEVVTLRGIKWHTVLVNMHIANRKAISTQSTAHPISEWMIRVAECFQAMARKLNLEPPTILVRDNDMKFTSEFHEALKRDGVNPYPLPIQAPLMNAHIERWIKSLKVECVNHFIPVGGKPLNYLISEYVEHYHNERPHQGIENRPIMPGTSSAVGEIECDTRLGGLLRNYHRAD